MDMNGKTLALNNNFLGDTKDSCKSILYFHNAKKYMSFDAVIALLFVFISKHNREFMF